jgi:hypothetical protein
VIGAGIIAGIAFLFRYDTGVALAVVHACIIAIAIYLRPQKTPNQLRTFAATFCAYLGGFALVTIPAAFYYLSVAPLRFFIHDMIQYPSKYYYKGRNLPFPRIELRHLDELVVYLPIAIVALALCVLFCSYSRTSTEDSLEASAGEQKINGFMVTFGLLTFVMYFKGLVRVSPFHMYLSIIPSVLLMAVLFQTRRLLPRLIRVCIICLVGLSILMPVWSSLREIRELYVEGSAVPQRLLWSGQASSDLRTAWCRTRNSFTLKFCFIPDDDRIQTIEFIEGHTHPGQELFVGVTRHDRILMNDNDIYFATQRLPATRWSDFNPDLQNTHEVQAQMVQELDTNAPPYIVLDSEFDLIREPNDSSISSGVTTLDDYIHKQYRQVDTFGKMSIWQRNAVPQPD